jgi:hypothetical protein
MSAPAADAPPGVPAESLATRVRDALSRLVRDPNPILVKELRATFRTKLFIRFLYLSTGLVGVIVLAGGAAVAAGSLPPAEVGQIVFQIFFSTALFVICLVAPAYAATTLTGEKETKTYESLILSGMRPWRIVRGKFLAAYGSMFLVLIALAPVVGIAFLFGGVSPWHVVVGYVALFVWLAPAVAFGLAISARLASTRIAILLATIVFFPTAFLTALFIAVLGEPASRAWSTGMQGPFWFTEALVSRWSEVDTLGLLVGLPLYFFGMPVWFLLASAVAGVRPAADDRSTPFKMWALVSAVGLLPIVAFVPPLLSSPEDCGELAIALVIAGGTMLTFYALLFMNEPPLPPRLARDRMKNSPLRFVYRLLGPGAAPTLRFGAALIFLTSFGMAFAAAVPRHWYWPHYGEHVRFDAALFVLALGQAVVATFVLALGTWLRVVLRNGIASRVLSIAVMAMLSIVPILLALIIDPDSIDRLDDAIPFVVQLSPTMPDILAVNVANEDMPAATGTLVVIPAIVYGLGAALFWVLVEARVAAVRRVDAERRREREERVRTSRPSIPLLQRRSRISGGGESPDSSPADPAADSPVPDGSAAEEPEER